MAVVFLDNYGIGTFGTVDNVVHRVKCALKHEALPPLKFTSAQTLLHDIYGHKLFTVVFGTSESRKGFVKDLNLKKERFELL